MSYIRNLTRTTSIGLIAHYNDRIFDDKTLNADFTRSDVSLRISKKMKLSQLELDVGKTQLNPKSSDSRQNSVLKARYQYQLPPTRMLAIMYFCLNRGS